MARDVLVAGVGMIPFAKPGANAPYDEMGASAIKAALADAGVGFDAVEQAYAGFVYGDSFSLAAGVDIFEPNAELAFQVDARLNAERVSGLQWG